MSTTMHIALRVDATALTGMGHFMRCLTLVCVLQSRGAHIHVVSRGLPMHLQDMLTARGMGLTVLTSPSDGVVDELAHAEWLGCSQAQDARDTAHALASRTWDWLIVDHYALDARWETALRGTARRIMVIDDLADRRHDCELLLDQNLYADMHQRYDGQVPAHAELLLGPHHALLRDEFALTRRQGQGRERDGVVRRILVFFGGVDAANHTGRVIEALATPALPEVAVDVVIGLQHPHRAEIERACLVAGFTYHVQTPHMAALIAAADLAISAGGVAMWERCCLGLPSLSVSTAENQRRQVADAAQAGLLYAPSWHEGAGHELADVIRRHTACLMENPALLRRLSHTAMQAVDGLGTQRVANAMGVDRIVLRLAHDGDARNLFDWRNHPSIRAVSHYQAPIAWEAHCHWLNAVLNNPDRLLLIGHVGAAPIGVVRFDINADVAEVSIYMVPDADVLGMGRPLLQRAEAWLAVQRPDIKRIRAEVLGENAASQRLFSGARYRVEQIHYAKAQEGSR